LTTKRRSTETLITPPRPLSSIDTIVAERSEATNLDDGGSILS